MLSFFLLPSSSFPLQPQNFNELIIHCFQFYRNRSVGGRLARSSSKLLDSIDGGIVYTRHHALKDSHKVATPTPTTPSPTIPTIVVPASDNNNNNTAANADQQPPITPHLIAARVHTPSTFNPFELFDDCSLLYHSSIEQ